MADPARTLVYGNCLLKKKDDLSINNKCLATQFIYLSYSAATNNYHAQRLSYPVNVHKCVVLPIFMRGFPISQWGSRGTQNIMKMWTIFLGAQGPIWGSPFSHDTVGNVPKV